MSRSYKKNPGFFDRSPSAKRDANVRVRRFQDEPQNGGWYKKLTCPWNICDHWFRYYPVGRNFSHTRTAHPGPFKGWRATDSVQIRKARQK